MKFSCLQENLSKGLSVALRFISNKPQLPVLSNILFSTFEGKLKLSATNLESGINIYIGAKIEEEGEITIPAKAISEFIGQLPAEKIEFETQENNIKIVCQKFKATIAGLPSQEFPPLPQASGKPTFTLETEKIVGPISRVAIASALDESRPVLSGIKILERDKGIIVVATDGFRLSVDNLEKEATGEQLDFVLPSRTVMDVIKILTEEKEREIKVEVNKETNQVIFALQNEEIICRLLEGQFPNFQKIIPQGFTTKAILRREDLLGAVKTASIFAREAANMVKFQIEGSKFQISANAPQLGENTVELDAKIEGEGGEIAFNCRFLLDFLNVVSGDEIVFEMTGPLSPGVFKVLGDEDFLHIIMPVRVQA